MKNINEIFNKYLEEVKRREIKEQRFKENNQDEIVMEKIYTHLKKVDSYLDDEDMYYHQMKYNFNYDEFKMLFDNLEEYAGKNYKYDKYNDGYGIEYYLRYKDMKIKLGLVVGQGSCIFMRKHINDSYDNLWNEDKSFTWDQYKENYEFDLTEIKRTMLQNDLNDFIQQMRDKLDLSYKEVLDELGNYIKERRAI